MRTGMDQAGRCGRDRTGGAGKGRGQRERERTLGDRKKKITHLVGDVQEYGGFYKEGGECANQFWIL